MTIHRTIGTILNPARHFCDVEDHGVREGTTTTLEPQRSPFETDGDKINFSEGFRALADKTQVHDRASAMGQFRNRLTHSVEVSRVGRSLGVAVGSRMIAFYGLHAAPAGEAFWRADPADIAHIVSAACLAHDIGNPPFGHEGEDEISNFYQTDPVGMLATTMVSDRVAAELRLHEGNAQGFRMITRSMGWRRGVGLNLTSATLAAFGKYPFPLRPGSKKYGVHHADLGAMEYVADVTGMQADPLGGWVRHPLAWLMEAADDICYLTVDLEDAAHVGIVTFDEVIENFALVLGRDDIDTAWNLARQDEAGRALKLLRSRMVKTLINACVEIYPSIAEDIEFGTLSKKVHGGGFLGHGRYGKAMETIRSYSKAKIYQSESVQKHRRHHRAGIRVALNRLNSDLIRVLKTDPGKVLHARDPNAGSLSWLPSSRVGTRVPANPDEAFPWLLDEVTLMSDRDILTIASASD